VGTEQEVGTLAEPILLLTVGHSYVVALNRRLVREMVRAGGDRWDVRCVSPDFFHGSRDLRPVPFEQDPFDVGRVTAVPARLTSRVHVFHYGRALEKLLRSQPWDVVHAWEEPYILAGAQLAWHTPRNARLVYSTYQNHAKNYPPPFKQFERYAMRRATAWITGGQTVVDVLKSRPGYVDRPFALIPMGVDTDHFRPDPAARDQTLRELNWTEPGAPVVGYLGRFTPEKGLSLLMNALDACPAPWRVMFVGAGPMEADLSTWAQKHGDRVRIVTGVLHDAVPRYLNAMDMLCAPSQTTPHWREQFGRMLIEAFACGLPVLGSDSGEIPHVIGDAGVVLSESDPAAWTRAIDALLQSPARRADLAGRAVDRARTTFAWPVVAARHLEFFEQLLARRP